MPKFNTTFKGIEEVTKEELQQLIATNSIIQGKMYVVKAEEDDQYVAKFQGVEESGKVLLVDLQGNVITSDILNTYQLKDLKTGSEVEYKVLSDNNLTDELKQSIEDSEADRHTHSNKEILDSYTQTEEDLSDAVSLRHTHSNKEILDSTTASYTTKEASKLYGIEEGAQVNPTDISELTDTTGVIPTDISELTDTMGVIPTDLNELTDTTNLISGEVSTHNTDVNAHTDIRTELSTVKAIAEGRLNAIHFDDTAQIEDWFTGIFVRPDSILPSDLVYGQNIYTLSLTDIDYWVSNEPATSLLDLTELSTDKIDLTDYYTKIETDTKFVEKVEGKGLSTNDYTTDEKNKLAGIKENAEVNVIESIEVNGNAIDIISKTVNLELKASDIEYSSLITVEEELENKEPLLPVEPENQESKYLGWDGSGNKIWKTIAVGSGGVKANIYLTTANSDISGYKEMNYMLEETATEVSFNVTNSAEILCEEYLAPIPLSTNVLNAGEWHSNFYTRLSSAVGTTQYRVEWFLYHVGGTTTTIATMTSPDIDSTTNVNVGASIFMPNIACLPTDRLGFRVFISTTRAVITTVYYTKGDGYASYVYTPIALRHSQLRDLNEDSNFQHISLSEKNKLSGLKKTQFSVASEIYTFMLGDIVQYIGEETAFEKPGRFYQVQEIGEELVWVEVPVQKVTNTVSENDNTAITSGGVFNILGDIETLLGGI